MNKQIIHDRIEILRQILTAQDLTAIIVPSADPHLSEYLPEYWQARLWLSGFTGSVGTLVVTADFAGLWTDGRYFIQAEQELMGTSIQLFRMLDEGVPTCRPKAARSAYETQPPTPLQPMSALRFAAAQAPYESPWLLTVSAIWRRFLRSACNGPQAGDSTLSTLGARLEFSVLCGLSHEDLLPKCILLIRVQ